MGTLRFAHPTAPIFPGDIDAVSQIFRGCRDVAGTFLPCNGPTGPGPRPARTGETRRGGAETYSPGTQPTASRRAIVPRRSLS